MTAPSGMTFNPDGSWASFWGLALVLGVTLLLAALVAWIQDRWADLDAEYGRDMNRELTAITHPTAAKRLAPHTEGRTCPKCRSVSFDLRARRCVRCGMLSDA